MKCCGTKPSKEVKSEDQKIDTHSVDIWKILTFILLGFSVFLLIFNVNTPLRFQSGEAVSLGAKQNEAPVVSREVVLPEDGVTLSVEWNDLGRQMVDVGIIDAEKFESLYATREGLDDEQRALLYNEGNGNLKINAENAGYILNLFWALGLANQNSILDEGPMQSVGDAGRFASTGGWSLSRGGTMDYYSKYSLIELTPDQQLLVEEVSKNIYRPCCGNSTYFPDCNHGMAMLGFLELLASQGASEQEMYAQALQLNAYWFPETYLNIAQYFQNKGIAWGDVDPKEALSANYSSGAGYQQVLASINPQTLGGGGGCGV